MPLRFNWGSRQFEIRSNGGSVDDRPRQDETAGATTWARRTAFGRDTLRHIVSVGPPFQLRALLDRDEGTVWRLNDARIVDLIVDRLHDGSLSLFEQQRAPWSAVSRSVDFVGVRSHEFVTPSSLRLRPAPAETPAAPVPGPEAAPELDDSAQVATLMEAARDGVPFCEVCEARKARRRAAALA